MRVASGLRDVSCSQSHSQGSLSGVHGLQGQQHRGRLQLVACTLVQPTEDGLRGAGSYSLISGLQEVEGRLALMQGILPHAQHIHSLRRLQHECLLTSTGRPKP